MSKVKAIRTLNLGTDFLKKVGIKTRYRIGIAMSSVPKLINKSNRNVKVAFLSNKKRTAITACSFCVIALLSVGMFNAVTGYEYSYDGQSLGIVEKTDDVLSGIEKAEKSLSQKTGKKVIIDEEKDITIKRVIKDKNKVDEEEDVVSALTSIEEMKTLSYSITINKVVNKKTKETTEHSIYLSSDAEANAVLEALKSEFTKKIDSDKLKEVSFEEEVKVEETKSLLEDITSTPKAFKYIMTGGIDEKIYKVKAGDSVASIADEFDISREKLKKWNPEIKDDNILYVNQEIQLREQIPLINVITTRNDTITEDFNAKVKYEDTDKLYEGQEIILKEGKSGNRTVNADIIERNGKQIDRIVLSSDVHKEPVVQEVMRGTKQITSEIGKGHYIMPMNGGSSSPFGQRWGRLHAGIDITAPVGTPVYAADAGIVKEAGATKNGYGVAVKIDHGNGRTTYYAHNSKVLVKAGDTVYQGQQIAESGNTGSSTGPHLHFETRFNEVPKDPRKFL